MCLDKLLQGGECLIYSFGLSYDWTFEEMLDSAGLDLILYYICILCLSVFPLVCLQSPPL